MNITKHTTCIITLFKNDAISNVLVTGEFADDASRYGLILRNGVPTFVCSSLYIKGGIAVNVSVKNKGSVFSEEGRLDDISVCRGGRLDVCPKATTTRIKECGGAVYCNFPWTMTDEQIKAAAQFDHSDMYISDLSGAVTIHENTRFHDLNVGRNANIDVMGGVLENSKFDHCLINLFYGTITDCVVNNSGFSIYGGNIGNVVFDEKSDIIFDVAEDDERFTCDNVVIKSGCKIIRMHHIKKDGSFTCPDLSKFTIEDGVTIEDKYNSDVEFKDIDDDTTAVEENKE